MEGKLYMGLEGSKTVYVVDSGLRPKLSRKADDLRDRRISALDVSQIEKLVIKTAAGEIQAEKNQGHWQISKPISARGDDEKISDMLAQVVNSRIDTFIPASESPGGFGLGDPRGTVSLYSASSDKPEVFELGHADDADKKKVYARLESRDSTCLVPATVGAIVEQRPNDLRDRHLLRLNFDIVDRVRIQPAGRPEIVLARKEEDWTIKTSGGKLANGNQARALMASLESQPTTAFISDVASDLARYGLDKPQLRLVFSSYASDTTAETGAGERPIESLSFGKSIGGSSVYARLENEPFIVSVSKAILDQIPKDSVEWQDLMIFKFRPEEITDIDVTHKGRPDTAIARTGNSGWRLVKGSGPLNQTNIESLTRTLSQLRAVRWSAGSKTRDSSEAGMIVTFIASGKRHRLLLGKRDNEGMWNAWTDEMNGEFSLSQPDVDGLILPLDASWKPDPSPIAPSQASPSPLRSAPSSIPAT